MTKNRFNRTITGEIYDSQNDDFVDEDYGGKPIGYEDGVIILLNTLHEENEQLKKELNYIQNSISEHIKHQKTELGQKALKEIIEDYNEWLLGHKELKMNV